MRYKAKIDWWIAAFFLVAIIVPWFTHLPWISAVIAAVLLVFGYPQWYETRSDGLFIRGGITRRIIAYDSIRSALMVDEGRSGIALSLDRIRIVYNFNSEFLIAPIDRAGFLTDLASRCPQLMQRGSELVARFD